MSPEGIAAVFTVLGTLIPVTAAAVYQILKWWREQRSQSHQQGRVDRQDKLAEFKILFDRMREDIDAKGEEIDQIQDRLAACRDREAASDRRCSRLEARCEYYERVLQAAGINFRPWAEVAPKADPDPGRKPSPPPAPPQAPPAGDSDGGET